MGKKRRGVRAGVKTSAATATPRPQAESFDDKLQRVAVGGIVAVELPNHGRLKGRVKKRVDNAEGTFMISFEDGEGGIFERTVDLGQHEFDVIRDMTVARKEFERSGCELDETSDTQMILESVLASKLIVFHYQFDLDNLSEECLALKNSGIFVEIVGRPTAAKRDRTSGRKASTGGQRFRDLTMSKIKDHAPSLVEYFEYLEKTFSAKVTNAWIMSYIPGKGGYLGFHPDNFLEDFRTSLTLGNNHFGAKKTISYQEGDSVGTFTAPHGTVVVHDREQGGAVKDWTKKHGTDNTDGTWTVNASLTLI